MNRALRSILVLFLALAALGIPVAALAQDAQQNAPQRYIVTFNPSTPNAGVLANMLARSNGFHLTHSFDTVVKGFSAELTPGQVQVLRATSSVVSIETDAPTHTTAQTVPTGIKRIGTLVNQTANINGVDNPLNIGVATLDTGVDPTHPDLNVSGGFNAINASTCDGSVDNGSWVDDNGHGTHVAGTIAARDNSLGVVGVAPGAHIWAVKVFDSNGSGYVSSIICGLNWIAANASTDNIRVINFSGAWSGSNTANCGNSRYFFFGNDTAHQAVCNVVDNYHIPLVVAAGNDGKDASNTLPAAYPETIAVGAIVDTDGQPGGLGPSTNYGADDTRASFSNYGSTVTIYAPGVNILSTWPGGGYATLSGTSMATPHVTGAVALYLLAHPSATPDQVSQALVSNGEAGSWGSPYGSQPLLNVGNAAFGPVAPPTPVHDVQVSNVAVANSPAYNGFANTVTAHISNQGNVSESISASLTDTGTSTIGSSPQSLTLNAGDAVDVSFTWTPGSTGSHTLEVTAATGSGSPSSSTTVNVVQPVHDVNITSVNVPSQVTQGQSASVSVGVTNVGAYQETFNVSLTSNPANAAGDPSAQSVTLSPGQSTTVNFSWATTNATTPQAYTLTAHAPLASDNTPADNDVAAPNQITVVAQPVNQNIWITGLTATNPQSRTIVGTVSVGSASGPVSGAVVTLNIRGFFVNSTIQVTTDSNGTAQYSQRIYWRATYTITVTGVSHGSDTYDSSQNTVTSISLVAS